MTAQQCTERTWCTVTDGQEHDRYHASDIVDLAGSEGSGREGWWAWLVENRGSPLVVEIEGAGKIGRAHV